MRIYITSRKRTRDSVSPSDFHFALDRPIELPEGARGYIDSFVCSNTWETIIENVNSRVYCQWSGDVPRILTLDAGPISSTTDLATKLTAGLAALAPTQATVTVTASDNRIIFSCPSLTSGQTFTVYGHTTLLTGTAPYAATAEGFRDACDVVGAMTRDIVCSFSVPLGAAVDATSQFVSFAPYRTLYIHSHIGTPQSYGPNGETTVIASIVVGNTVPGDLVSHHHQGLLASPIDLPPVLGDMHFTLRDYQGRVIDTDGHPISFTLVCDTGNL